MRITKEARAGPAPGRPSVLRRVIGPLDDALARIDLSVVLSGQVLAHAVMLPDPAAARLPLAAFGQVRNRLLDPGEDITWLPNLLPIRTRQAPHAPRSGVVTVFTPDIENGGTDSDVLLEIGGHSFELDNDANNFERSKTDTFRLSR